jgi:hypothetical protein
VWQAPLGTVADGALPGGTLNGVREAYGGTPALAVGGDYVVFLWTSHSGFTQIIGLSQGLFAIVPNGSTGPMAVRPAASERMVGPNGKQIADTDFQMPLSDFRNQVQSLVRGGK